jgi:hypothetical protein
MCVREEQLPQHRFYPAPIFAFVNLRRIAAIVTFCAASLVHSQATADHASGIAWKVRGTWRIEGTREPLLTGDPIHAGGLLQPTAEDATHSITILLPDGQSILYECFTARDCARGFRVPALFRQPDPFSAEMLARIRAVLRRQQGPEEANPAPQSHLAKDEAVAVLGSANRIEIGGIASNLPNGAYVGDLVSVGSRYPSQSGMPLQKSGRTIALAVPGPGLFLLTISDSMKWPRIQLMIGVVAASDTAVAKGFDREHALLAKWIDDLFGWPVHDFQRAYLEALMLSIKPLPNRDMRVPIAHPPRTDVTAEPTFSPRPGMVAGNVAVTLHCATPGASIHYSVDTSQPLETSPIYRAPVIMTTLPLTIKAFASAPGKKDSPVVTGNFRVSQRLERPE